MSGTASPQSSYKRQFFRDGIKSGFFIKFLKGKCFLDSDSCWKGEARQLWSRQAGKGWHNPHHHDLHSSHLSRIPRGNHRTRNPLAALSAASSETSTCEIPAAEWPGGTLLPLYKTPQSFPTLKKRVLGFGFCKPAVMYHISSLAPAGRRPFHSFG